MPYLCTWTLRVRGKEARSEGVSTVAFRVFRVYNYKVSSWDLHGRI